MTTSHARSHRVWLHQRALLDAAQRDDWRAMDELLRRYESLVRAIVRSVGLPRGCERDDIAQEARLGVVSAIRDWRPARGPFGAFAAQCVRAHVINALNTAAARKHQVLSRAASLDLSAGWKTSVDPDSVSFRVSLYELIPSTSRFDQPEAMLLAREQFDRVMGTCRRRLTTRERAALIADLDGKSQEQLAAEQGSTRKAVHLALRRVRRKLAAEEALAT
jgi:RNA polymerase sporulation-specific sigma factor